MTASQPPDETTNITGQAAKRPHRARREGTPGNSEDAILKDAEWEMQQNSKFYNAQDEEQGL